MTRPDVYPLVVHVQWIQLSSILLGRQKNVRALLVSVPVRHTLCFQNGFPLLKLSKCVKAGIIFNLRYNLLHIWLRHQGYLMVVRKRWLGYRFLSQWSLWQKIWSKLLSFLFLVTLRLSIFIWSISGATSLLSLLVFMLNFIKSWQQIIGVFSVIYLSFLLFLRFNREMSGAFKSVCLVKFV